MAKKPNFLKNLLTTASALAVATGAANAYAANDVISTGAAPAVFLTGANFKNANGALVGAVNADVTQTIFFGVAQGMTLDQAGNYGTLNAYGFGGQTLTSSKDVSFVSIINDITATAAAQAANQGKAVNPGNNVNGILHTIGVGNTTEIKGAITGLGNVTLAGAGSTLKLSGDNSEMKGTITATVGNNGGVVVNATGVKFSGAVGANGAAISTFTINDGKSATLDAALFANGAVTIGGANGGSLTVNAGKNITANDITAGVAATGANTNSVFFNGASVVTGTIGNGAALDNITIQGAGTVELTGVVLKSKTIQFSDDAAALKLNTNATTVTGDVTTTVAGKGKIIAKAATPVFIGNIGSATNGLILEAVELDANVALFKSADANSNLSVNATKITGAADVRFNSDQEITINTNIGVEGTKFAAVKIRDLADVKATKATLAAGKTVYTTLFDIAPTAKDNILILGQGSAIKGNVSANSANSGILQVAGDSTVTQVGSTNAIKYLEFTAAKTLTIENATAANTAVGVNDANGIRFTADGTLKYTGTANITFNKATTVATDGTGSIIADNLDSSKTITFSKIGVIDADPSKNKSLKLLQVKGGVSISLEESAAIDKIDIGNTLGSLANSFLSLDVANGNFLIGNFAHNTGSGVLRIDETGMTLKSGTFANDKPMDQIAFIGNNVLNIEDGVSLLTANGFINNAANRGSLVFKGASVISGKVGANAKFNNIAVTGKGKLVEFKNEVNANGNVTISEGAAVQFDDVITAANITGANNNEGTVKFSNTAPINVVAAVGANRLDTVEINGTGIVFKDAAFGTNNLNFTSAATATAIFEAIGADNFINTKITSNGKGIHNVTLNKGADQAFNQTVGTEANPMGNFKMVADNTVPAAPVSKTVTINNDFFGNIITDTNSTGNVILQSHQVLNLGDATNQLLKVTFQGPATVKDVYSKDIEVAAGQTATFKGKVTGVGGEIKLFNASTAAFVSGSTLNAALNGNANGNGNATFDGATITQAIGSANALNTITLTGSNQVGAGLKAGNINVAANGTLFATTDVVLNGVTNIATGGTFNINENTVTLTNGNSVFNGTSNFNVTIDKEGDAGEIVVDGAAAADLDFSKATVVNINVTDQQLSLPTGTENYEIIKVANGGTLTGAAKLKLNTSNVANRFSNFTLDTTTANSVKLVQANNASAVLSGLVQSLNNKDLTADASSLGNAKNTADAQTVQNDLGKIADNTTLVDAVRRLTTPIETNSAVMNNVASAGKQSVINRLGLLSPTPGMQTASAGSTGVSAGDDARFGAWVAPFFNQNTQKAKNSAAGYKSNSFGGTVGFDTMTNADMTIGLAGTFAKTDVKHKDIKSGDKTKADTFIFSIYGIQQLTNEWFMQAVASFSSSKVKNKEKRITSAGSQTASGSFDTTTYGADVMLGYGHKIASTTLTPMFGVNFSRINDGGYKETGTTNQNLSITKKAVNKFEFVAGLRAQFDSMATSDIQLTPEIHGFVKYDVIGKNPTITAKLDGLVTPFTQKSAKVEKATYNVGFSVNAESGMYEYGAGYDLTVANKFIGHQGIVKLRVNF
jgi:outer membrane autotransporter protein